MKQSVNVVDGGAKNPLVLMVQMIQLSRVLELWDFASRRWSSVEQGVSDLRS